MTTLYLKYRPQKISELDLVDVRETLSKIVSSGNIPHAFLFEGPRGSGKTSAARIIAKILNCTNLSKDFEPCNDCAQCLSITKGSNIDVIELDAASHRGIDDIRLIREAVKLSPAGAKKKIYIIDEAHMLTTEASNALLKTLEEPPAHVVFILATTNSEKLLDTIKSRTVRVNFKKATVNEITKSLLMVLKKEKVDFNEGVLDLISKSADGSFRDAKKTLEDLIVKGLMNDVGKVAEYLGGVGDFNTESFISNLYPGDLTETISVLKRVQDLGVPAKNIYTKIVGKLTSELLNYSSESATAGLGPSLKDTSVILEIFIDCWNSYQNDISDYIPLYLAVVTWCEKNRDGTKDRDEKSSGKGDTKSQKKSPTRTNGGFDVSKTEVDESGNNNGKKDIKINLQENGDTGAAEVGDEAWHRVLSAIRLKNASTEALLRAAKPSGLKGNVLTLGVYYKFHKEKLESAPHKMCLEDELKSVLGMDIKVECFLTQPPVFTNTGTENQSHYSNGQDAVSVTKGNKSVVLAETNDTDLMDLVNEVFGS